jgi:hypothetical protein
LQDDVHRIDSKRRRAGEEEEGEREKKCEAMAVCSLCLTPTAVPNLSPRVKSHLGRYNPVHPSLTPVSH